MERKGRFRPTVTICVLILAFGQLATAQYGGGAGEPNDPYQIYTAEQMNAIGANPNDWNKHFKLMADIDLSTYTGTEFNIIGTEVTIETTRPLRGPGSDYIALEEVLIPFSGTFDGNGHVVSNLHTPVGMSI